ncbi:hypothetical protein FEM08_21450 [Flavobacterium gilvum]|nr:hypothetical protein FEM08_21450 [Flavobacterium gilvum]
MKIYAILTIISYCINNKKVTKQTNSIISYAKWLTKKTQKDYIFSISKFFSTEFVKKI